MARQQTDRELVEALMRSMDPYTYPQGAPNVPKMAGQQLLELAQALERDPNRKATGLEEVVELIGKMGVINPLKTAGSLMQLDKPTVERMAQFGMDAAKRAYDDPPGTAQRLGQRAIQALGDPVGTAGELSVSDVVGGSGLLSKLAGGAKLTGPALMAAMVPGSDVPRPKTGRALRAERLMQEQLDRGEVPGALERGRLTEQSEIPVSQMTEKQAKEKIREVLQEIYNLEDEILDYGGMGEAPAELLEKLDSLRDDEFRFSERLQQIKKSTDVVYSDPAAARRRTAAQSQLDQLANLDDVEKARLDRAVQQGFNIDAFHGTKGDIESFDPGLLGATTGAPSARRGFFFSADPETANSYAQSANLQNLNPEQFSELAQYIEDPYFDEVIADKKELLEKFKQEGNAGEVEYYTWAIKEAEFEKMERNADKIESVFRGSQSQNILPVKLRLQNPLEYDFGGQSYREVSYNDLLKQAQEAGNDGAIFRNTTDGGGVTDIYVVFEPSQIRSRFAMFDPNEAPTGQSALKMRELEQINDDLVNKAGAYLDDDMKRPIDFSQYSDKALREWASGAEDPDLAYELIKKRLGLKVGGSSLIANAPPILFPLGVGTAAAAYSANKEE